MCVFMKPKLLVEYKVYWRSQAIIKYFLSLFGKFWECICCRNMVLRFFCSIIKIIQGNKRNPWTFTSYCQLGWLSHNYYDKIEIHNWIKIIRYFCIKVISVTVRKMWIVSYVTKRLEILSRKTKMQLTILYTLKTSYIEYIHPSVCMYQQLYFQLSFAAADLIVLTHSHSLHTKYMLTHIGKLLLHTCNNSHTMKYSHTY